MDPWYITGITEGEGSFTFSRNERNLNLYFALRLTWDRTVVQDIQDYFGGIGRIYHVAPQLPQSIGGPLSKGSDYFRVTRLEELVRISDHFDKFPLRGTKSISYQIWRKMLVLKVENFRKPPRAQLIELAIALSAVATHNRPWKPEL